MQSLLLTAKSVLVAAALSTSVSVMANDYHITPAPGEVTELSHMVLTFNGTWEQVDRTKKFSFTGPEGVEVPKLMSGSNGEAYTFDFDGEVITTPGEYTLTIPAGRFGVGGVLLPEATFTWTVVSQLSGPGEVNTDVYHITPSPGRVSSLTEMVLKFDGDWAQADRSKKFSFTGPEGVDLPALKSFSDGTAYIFYFEDDATITTPGEYSLSIPEGRFAVNGVDAPAATFVWTITEDGDTPAGDFPNYMIMPEPGEYETLSEGFSLWFDTEETVTVNNRGVYLDGPSVSYDVMVEVPHLMPYITVIPVDAEGEPIELTAPGEYTLIFSLASITVGETFNQEPLVFKYTVAGVPTEPWMGEYTADPADESTVTSLKEVNITFDAAEVKVAEFAKPQDFPYLLDNETMVVVSKGTVYAEENVLSIMLDKEVKTSGYYLLVVPAALITVDGAPVESDLYLMYEVEGSAAAAFEYTFTLTPASGEIIGAESPVSITFAGDDLASVTNDPFASGYGYPYFTNDMGAYNPRVSVAANGMTFTFDHQWPFETDGEYTFVIPAGYFILTSTTGEEVNNQRIEATYILKTTSIDSLNADDAPAATFTLQGVRVGGTSLPAGVYIINGKKAYLK